MKPLYAKITDSKSIDRLIKQLEDYRDSLPNRLEILISRLIDIGITVAKSNTGQYGNMIMFEKKLNPVTDGCEGILVASDGQKIIREWYKNDEIVSAEVSPLLMAEFGSGWFASVLQDIEGVGQGTFPGQTHAFDVDGWRWTTPGDNITHHSYGEAPTYPMHKALNQMLFEIDRIAQEVFQYG